MQYINKEEETFKIYYYRLFFGECDLYDLCGECELSAGERATLRGLTFLEE